MHRAEAINSARNPLLKEIRRAVSSGALTAGGLCVAESLHMLDEALKTGCDMPIVLAAEGVLPVVEQRLARAASTRLIGLPEKIFEGISSTASPQGVMALVRPRAWRMDDLFRGNPLLVVLDGLQDPGNAGAIIRAAEAFGASGAFFLKGTVSAHNPKTLRGSAGSLFRLPYLEGLDAQAVREACLQRRIAMYATVAHGGEPLDEAALSGGCAMIIGGEARGVSEPMRRDTQRVRIPTSGVESLNASVAAAIFLYEASRQRRVAGNEGGRG